MSPFDQQRSTHEKSQADLKRKSALLPDIEADNSPSQSAINR
jgi:hypothetical protein